MGLWDKLFGEFVDVIDWLDASNDTMVYRFNRYGNEIKYGAKLTVRESQMAVFVNEGEVADVLGPGIYELETRNLPILSTLQHWDHAFESPFKAEVYFFNMRQFTGLKWGTKNPIMLRDEEFGPVRLRSFGTYTVRISDPHRFIREIVGTDGHFTVDEISHQLRDIIVSRYSTILGSSGIPVLDMAANQDQLGEYITQRIAPEFTDYGLELTKVLVENISLPPAVEEALDKRTSMGMIGNLDKYLKYGTAEAIQSGGDGSASSAVEMGLGFAMANKMANEMQGNGAPTITPPPLPADRWHIAIDNRITGPYTLEELKQLVNDQRLNEHSLAWKPGMADWQEANSIDTLRTLIVISSQVPPELPKKNNG